jgi:hypothetical protein
VNVFIITWTSGDYGLGRPMMSLVQTGVIFYVQSREIHLRTVLRVVRFMVFNTTFAMNGIRTHNFSGYGH